MGQEPFQDGQEREHMNGSPSEAAGDGNSAEASTDWSERKIFTTGEAAQICKVSQQTIIRCFDAGRLGGFRVPGSKFRRIPRAELLRFMRDNDIPTENLEGAGTRVLVVDDDPAIQSLFTDLLGRSKGYRVKTAGTGYDAGMLTQSFRPHVLVLDYMLPDINGNLVCQRIRENPELSGTKIIIVSGVVNQDEIDKLRAAGADDFVRKPFNIQQIIDRISALTA
ncbi:MAG: response regulator [Planctomycetaceae bacterium]|jgi:excisionase family DNA binding protein|nr:response regulator [Planctomycetaceae bacterium]